MQISIMHSYIMCQYLKQDQSLDMIVINFLAIVLAIVVYSHNVVSLWFEDAHAVSDGIKINITLHQLPPMLFHMITG